MDSFSKTTGFNMYWRTTVLQTTVFMPHSKQHIFLCFSYDLANHCPPNHSFYKPAVGSNSKTTDDVQVIWRTTVVKTIVLISPQPDLIQKQQVVTYIGASLFSQT